MRFDPPFQPGRLIQRYKRFLADITLDSGETITAHSPNTGSMLGCVEPGSRVWVSRDDKPTRKLKYTWEIASDRGVPVGVHTGRANALVQEAIESGAIRELAGAATIRREVRYGKNSRIDLLLEGDGRAPCYVEVKNVTLGRNGVARFPDAVTERGAKHLRELMGVVAQGARAAMLFAVQREDCTCFAPADDIDPVYGETLRRAAQSGVSILAYRARVTPEEIRLLTPLPVEL
jgi:sugar fermentation stimulation protein A